MTVTEDRSRLDRLISEGHALWRVLGPEELVWEDGEDVFLDLRLPTKIHGSPEQQAAPRGDP